MNRNNVHIISSIVEEKKSHEDVLVTRNKRIIKSGKTALVDAVLPEVGGVNQTIRRNGKTRTIKTQDIIIDDVGTIVEIEDGLKVFSGI